MNKQIFILLFFTLVCLPILAQDAIVTKDGKTMYGKITSETTTELSFTTKKGYVYNNIPKSEIKSIFKESEIKSSQIEATQPLFKLTKTNIQNSITVKTLHPLSTSLCYKGDILNCFQITEASNKSLIGKNIIAQVIFARKSNINGQEGVLEIRPLYINTDTEKIDLMPDDIIVRGLNRSNVKFWTSFTVVMMFIPGTGARITTDDEFIIRLK